MTEEVENNNEPTDRQMTVSALALCVGILAAYAVLAFRLSIDFLLELFFGAPDDHLASMIASLEWWHVLAVPTFGGLAIGLFLQYVMPDGRAHGVPDVLESRALLGAKINLKTGLLSALVHTTSLGVGASAGREGPAVHLGATMASALTQRLHLSQVTARTLLACGVASAVTASFNAPIAGAMFALEVVLGHYALHAFVPIVLSTVAGTIITRIHFAESPTFLLPQVDSIGYGEFPLLVALGICCAATAIAFMHTVFKADDFARKFEIPLFLRPVIGGFLVGCIGLMFPEVMSIGYEATNSSLNEQLPLVLLLMLIPAKIIATAITIASRFGGGVFSPGLYLGAMVGGAFGLIVAYLPGEVSSHGTYAIAGMGAVAAAILGAPISTVMIGFELTGSYEVSIVLMVTVAIACTITQQVVGKSFFHWQLERRGILLQGGHTRRILQHKTMQDVMRAFFPIVEKHEEFIDVAMGVLQCNVPIACVVDEEGHLLGVVTSDSIHQASNRPASEAPLAAGDMMEECQYLLEHETFERALALFDAVGAEALPVLDKPVDGEPIGLVLKSDILSEITQELSAADAEAHDPFAKKGMF